MEATFRKIKRPAGCWKHPNGPNRNASYGDSIMASKALPSPEVLRQLLRYEPETGKLFWLPRPDDRFATRMQAKTWNTRFADKQAFTAMAAGYPHGRIHGKVHLAHRVIWAMQTGSWPTNQVDHINGEKADNTWANLREATGAQNQWNKGARKDCASGYKGVRRVRSKWQARLRTNGHTIQIGGFDTAEDAFAAYCEESARQRGEFSRTV